MEQRDENTKRDRNTEPTISIEPFDTENMDTAKSPNRTIPSVFRLRKLLSNPDVFMFGGRMRLSVIKIVRICIWHPWSPV